MNWFLEKFDNTIVWLIFDELICVLKFEIYTLKSWNIIENSNKMMKVKYVV